MYKDFRNRPVQGKIEDLRILGRQNIWYPDSPSNAASLARMLGISPVPSRFLYLLPPELEEKMAEKELAWKNRKLEEIEYTKFEFVKQRRTNQYEPVVVEQITRAEAK